MISNTVMTIDANRWASLLEPSALSSKYLGHQSTVITDRYVAWEP